MATNPQPPQRSAGAPHRARLTPTRPTARPSTRRYEARSLAIGLTATLTVPQSGFRSGRTRARAGPAASAFSGCGSAPGRNWRLLPSGKPGTLLCRAPLRGLDRGQARDRRGRRRRRDRLHVQRLAAPQKRPVRWEIQRRQWHDHGHDPNQGRRPVRQDEHRYAHQSHCQRHASWRPVVQRADVPSAWIFASSGRRRTSQIGRRSALAPASGFAPLAVGVTEPTAGTPFTVIDAFMLLGGTKSFLKLGPNLASAKLSTPGGVISGGLSVQSSDGGITRSVQGRPRPDIHPTSSDHDGQDHGYVRLDRQGLRRHPPEPILHAGIGHAHAVITLAAPKRICLSRRRWTGGGPENCVGGIDG